MGLLLFHSKYVSCIMAERLETSSTATSSTNTSLPLIRTGDWDEIQSHSIKRAKALTAGRASCVCSHYYLSNLFINCTYCIPWAFASSPCIFCNTVYVFPLDPDLCAMLQTSSAYLQSLVNIKTQAEAPRLTHTDILLPTWPQRQTDMQHIHFLHLFHLPPWVSCQPIFALVCCYLRCSWKVVMEDWLRPVTSCTFTSGTLSGKEMARPARCSSHF